MEEQITELSSIFLVGVAASSVAWADYDNDGDLDILIAGVTSSYQKVSKIYQNKGNAKGPVQYSAISMLGHVVTSGTLYQSKPEILLGHLKAGMCLLKLNFEGKQEYSTLIKNK